MGLALGQEGHSLSYDDRQLAVLPPSEDSKCQLFSSFPLFALSKRAWEKSETSEGMKKMGLKFDLSVA